MKNYEDNRFSVNVRYQTLGAHIRCDNFVTLPGALSIVHVYGDLHPRNALASSNSQANAMTVPALQWHPVI